MIKYLPVTYIRVLYNRYISSSEDANIIEPLTFLSWFNPFCLDWGACNLDGVSFGIEHELVDPVMIDLEDIILNGTISVYFKFHLRDELLPERGSGNCTSSPPRTGSCPGSRCSRRRP
jgi:hypothetical protein